MRVLAIDTASESCSAALFEDGVLLAGFAEVIGRGHAERLLPLIARLPQSGRATRICVSLGPGSFTGVRIGLAAARALGLAWNAQVLGYPTLALVAAIARAGEAVPVTVAMRGGHGEWFVQNFSRNGFPDDELASLVPLEAVRAASHEVVAGNQAEALVELRGHGTALPILPDARALQCLPEGLITASLSPLYGRPPDARLPQQPPRDR